MCLDSITIEQKRDRKVYCGYKVLRKWSPSDRPEFIFGLVKKYKAFTSVPTLRRWIKAAEPAYSMPYDYGFHVFLNLEDALAYQREFSKSYVYLVECRGLVAKGTQNIKIPQTTSLKPAECIVVKEIKINSMISKPDVDVTT